jgi:predicted DNA-binding WGR domain protein
MQMPLRLAHHISEWVAAEPAVAADRAGITACRGSTSSPPALLLNCVVRQLYHRGGATMSSQPDAVDDPVFGHLELAYPGWRGRMPFPALAACQIRWQLTPDEERMVPVPAASPEVDGYVAVAVHDEAGDGPDDPQRVAYRFLISNQDQVVANILSGLVFGMKHYSSFVGSPFEPDAEQLGLVSVDGVQELVTLYEIDFFEQAKDNESYVTAEFSCCWDEEHGISLLIHHGKAVACSVGNDFCNRGSTENLEAHAKYCEIVDPSPGAAAAPPAAGGTNRYFELVAGSSRKFWEISWSGSDVTTRWGRIGTDGQSKTKSFKDTAAAKKEYDQFIVEKTSKGYTEK